jgi:hypothetical protein
LQWSHPSPGQNSKTIPDTVIRASDLYENDQIGNLLCASQSTLSLALSGDMAEDTVSAVLLPEITSNVPISKTITYSRGSGQRKENSSSVSSEGFKTARILETLAASVQYRIRSPKHSKLKNMGKYLALYSHGYNGISMSTGNPIAPLLELALSPVCLLFSSELTNIAVVHIETFSRGFGDIEREYRICYEAKPSFGSDDSIVQYRRSNSASTHETRRRTFKIP